MAVSYIFNGKKLSIMLQGSPTFVDVSNPNFKLILQAINDNKDEAYISSLLSSDFTINVEQYVNKSESVITYKDGKIYNGDQVVHNNIAERIADFAKYGLPFEHLLKFVERIERNPSYNSRNQFYEFLEHKDLVITEDGYFLAYKSVKSDYTDFHTGTIDNSPGQTISMDRRLIDDNPNSSCSRGLHVGAIGYVSNFGGNGKKIVIVKVDPMNVVSVPHDSSCQKCRVCEYMVISDMKEPFNKPLYKSSGEEYEMNCDIDEDDFEYYDDEEYDDYDEGEVFSYEDEDEDEYEDEDFQEPETFWL